MSESFPGIHEWLAEARERCRVPGVSLALCLPGGEQRLVTAGVLDVRDDRAVQPSTRFRIGSIVKLLTACGVLACVDRFRLQLDVPVAAHVPEFHTQEPERAALVTPRHLLTHTGGFFGDLYDSTGEDRGCWQRYVGLVGQCEHTFLPGEVPSYCNSGYVVLAHLTERLTEMSWDDALRDLILQPLGLSSIDLLAKIGGSQECAAGHLVDPHGIVTTVAAELPLHSLAPAGSLATATALDVARLGAMLVNEGRDGHGQAVLPSFLITQQRNSAVLSPSPSFADGWGLGLMRFDHAGEWWGHDGVVTGQSAFLRIVPRLGLSIALLTNGGDGRLMLAELLEWITSARGDLLPPPRFEMPGREALDPRPYVGIFVNQGYNVRIDCGQDSLGLQLEPKPPGGSSSEVLTTTLRRAAEDTTGELFMCLMPGSVLAATQRFSRFHQAQAQLLHFRGRAFRRADAPAHAGLSASRGA